MQDNTIEVSVTDDGVGIQGEAADGHFGLEQIPRIGEGTGGRIEISKNGRQWHIGQGLDPAPMVDRARSCIPSSRPGTQPRPAHLSLVPLEAGLER